MWLKPSIELYDSRALRVGLDQTFFSVIGNFPFVLSLTRSANFAKVSQSFYFFVSDVLMGVSLISGPKYGSKILLPY